MFACSGASQVIQLAKANNDLQYGHVTAQSLNSASPVESTAQSTESVSSSAESIKSASPSAESASTSVESPSSSMRNRSGLPKYYVNRTVLNRQLPVYQHLLAKGTRVYTVIKRIEGDAAALRSEILPLVLPSGSKMSDKDKESKLPIITPSNSIIIKGDHVQTIKQYLTLRGF